MNNEEFIKNYLVNLGLSIQADIEEIKSMPWNDNPYALIRMGDLSQCLRYAKESSQSFKELILSLSTDSTEEK